MPVFAGDIIYASDVNKLSQDPLAEVTVVASSAAITAETVILTLPSATYKANQAYEVKFEGAYSVTATTNVVSAYLRKTNVAGAIISNFGPRLPQVSLAGSGFLADASVMFQIGGADVTAALCVTLQSSAASVTLVANPQRPARVRALPRGAASLYTNLPTLT